MSHWNWAPEMSGDGIGGWRLVMAAPAHSPMRTLDRPSARVLSVWREMWLVNGRTGWSAQFISLFVQFGKALAQEFADVI